MLPKWVLAVWMAALVVLWGLDWAGIDRTLNLLGNIALGVFVLYQVYGHAHANLEKARERNEELR